MRVNYIPIVLHLLQVVWFRVEGQTIAQVNNLSSTLLSGYNKNTRPVNAQSTVVTVTVSLELIAIPDFNEVEGKLSTVMLFDISWVDEGMVWDILTNNNIENLVVSQKLVWKPLLTLSNPYGDLKELGDDDWVTVTYIDSGEANWTPLARLDTTCSIDTTYYPFDTQQCILEMFVFGYGYGHVYLVSSQSTVGTSYYGGHATWNLASSSVEILSSSNQFHILTVTFELERMSGFTIVNFLVPLLLLAALNPLVFLLPQESGGREGYAITILLSLSVFLTILGDYIPRNTDPMSLLTYMLMILYILSSVIAVVVILNMQVYYRSDSKPVGNLASGFVRLCRGQCSKNKIKPTESTSNDVEIIQNNKTMKMHRQYDTVADSTDNTEEISWKDVAFAIDKIACAFVYLFMFVMILAFLITLKRNA